MSEMIERVAQAICGDDNPANILSIHRSRARLAIEAMCEPTDEMIRAGVAFPKLGYAFIDMKNAWAAAINEAWK